MKAVRTAERFNAVLIAGDHRGGAFSREQILSGPNGRRSTVWSAIFLRVERV